MKDEWLQVLRDTAEHTGQLMYARLLDGMEFETALGMCLTSLNRAGIAVLNTPADCDLTTEDLEALACNLINAYSTSLTAVKLLAAMGVSVPRIEVDIERTQ